MAEMGKYIYGIINSNTDFRLFIPKDFLEAEKGGAEGVYTIPYQDISAVVCDSRVVDYTHTLKDTLARLLVGHQMVIEKIMDLEPTVIPMRLGTFAQDEEEVRGILNKGYKIIKDVFAKISDKVEIDVACTWSDFNSVLKEVGQDREIKELKERLLEDPDGVTVDDQMKVGVMVKKALDKKREGYAQELQDALKVVSRDCKAHELMDDKMVMNSAFLIDKAGRIDFERVVEGLNAKFHNELNFRCVGPLPPYSFYTLEIKKIKFEEVDWARRKLGLNDSITKDEIKKAYHRSAQATHPDKNPATPGAEEEFDEVNRAYKLLVDYCEACEQVGQKDRSSLKEEEFKENAILVKVRE